MLADGDAVTAAMDGPDGALAVMAVEGGTLDLPYLRMKGEAMMQRDFAPAFRLELAAKDAALVRQAAEDHGMDLPLIETIAQRLAAGAKEHGDADFSATYLTSKQK